MSPFFPKEKHALISFLICGPSREYDGRFLFSFFRYELAHLRVLLLHREILLRVCFVWIPVAKLVIHENDVPAKARNNGIIRSNIVRRRWEIVELFGTLRGICRSGILIFFNTIFFVSVFDSCRY